MRQLFLMALFWGALPIILVTDPFYGILEYTFINIIRPEQLLWSGAYGVGRIFYAVQVTCFTSWLIHRKKLTPEYTPTPLQVKLMVIIAIGMIISTSFAIAPKGLSWRWTSQFMKVTLFCFVMSKSINTTKKLERYYVVSLVWFMLLEIWGIQQKLGGNVRMEGIGGVQLSDVNDLSSVVVLYFPMAYYSMFSRKKWIRLFVGIPATIISVIFIFFGGSRGAFLGLAACMVYILLKTSGLQRIKITLTLLVIAIPFYVIISAVAPEGFFDEYTARLRTMLGEEDVESGELEYEGSAAGRVAMWKAVYYFMKQHPEFWLTGLGVRGFSAIYIDYIDELEPYLDVREYHLIFLGGSGGKAIHNTYLNIAASGGIVVFLPWIYLLFSSWFQARNIPRKYPKIMDGVDIHNYAQAIETGLFGAAISVMFINAEFVDFYYWYLTMTGIIANLGKAKLKREELGIEDEEFMEPSIRKPAYSSSFY